MKGLPTYLVLLLSVAVSIQNVSQEPANPGFRAIITTKGLKYAHVVGLRVLKEWLCNSTIPTQNLTSQVGLANITYYFSEWNIYSVDFGESSLTSDTRGFVLTVKDFAMSFSANYRVVETDWPHFTDEGSGDVSIGGVSLTISVDLLVNRTGSGDGRFAANVTSCSFSIDKINMLFRGGASYMYNLFGPALNGFLKRELNKKACNELIKWFNEMTQKYVNPLPTTINVTDGIEIDYGLVSDGDFSRKGRVVTNHKGEFQLLTNATDPPFQPPPLPDPSEEEFPETKMIHIVVSKYVAETAAYAFKETGQLAYNITSGQLWIFEKTDTWCASTLVPQTLCDKFPKMNVMLGVAVSDAPTFNITTNHTAAEAEVEVTMFVAADGNGRQDVAFVLEFHAQADVVPFFRDETNHICGTISNAKIVDITLKNSTIGQFNVSCSASPTLISALF
jgi:hypothetical protein